MAKYDRDFLVPYLQDVCALYMADRKIESEISEKSFKCMQYERGCTAEKPSDVSFENESIGCGGVIALLFALMGAFCIIMMLVAPAMGMEPGGFWLFCIFLGLISASTGGYFFFAALKEARAADKRNEAKLNRWKSEMELYRRRKAELEDLNKANKQKIPEITKQIRRLNSERVRLRNVLASVYGANVIPSRYRNIYAAVFLYDWFSTSGADDLDMALNMFVLEEIKDKLDSIIHNQSEIILNQRLILAKQQESLEQQREHHRMLCHKLDMLQASEDERNKYLSMIESNTATTAYFLAANYIK